MLEFEADQKGKFLPYEREAVQIELKSFIDQKPCPHQRKIYNAMLDAQIKWWKRGGTDEYGVPVDASVVVRDALHKKHLAKSLEKADLLFDAPIIQRQFVTGNFLRIMEWEKLHEVARNNLVDRDLLPPRTPLKVDKYKHETYVNWIANRLVLNEIIHFIRHSRAYRIAGVSKSTQFEKVYWGLDLGDKKYIISRTKLAIILFAIIGAIICEVLIELLPSHLTAPGGMLEFLHANIFEPRKIWRNLTLVMGETIGRKGDEELTLGGGSAVFPFNVRAMEHVPDMPGLRRVPVDSMLKTESWAFMEKYPFFTKVPDRVVWYNRNLTDEQIARCRSREDQHQRKISNLMNNSQFNILLQSKTVQQFDEGRFGALEMNSSIYRNFFLQRKAHQNEGLIGPLPVWRSSIGGRGELSTKRLNQKEISDSLLKELREADEKHVRSPDVYWNLTATTLCLGFAILFKVIRRAGYMSTYTAQEKATVRMNWWPIKRFDKHLENETFFERMFYRLDEEKVKSITNGCLFLQWLSLLVVPQLLLTQYSLKSTSYDLFAFDPRALLRRDFAYLLNYYGDESDYWKCELSQPEFFNLKDALVVDNCFYFYEQGGPVLKPSTGYDHLTGHRAWFTEITGQEWSPDNFYRFGKTN